MFKVKWNMNRCFADLGIFIKIPCLLKHLLHEADTLNRRFHCRDDPVDNNPEPPIYETTIFVRFELSWG